MIGRESLLWGRPSEPENATRRSILHCLRMLAPFREAQPEGGPPSPDLAEGERQFYAFIKGLYEVMYSDPAFFLIPEGEYDEYLAHAPKPESTPEHARKPDQKECRLRNSFQQAIRFYAAYLYELGIRAESLENGVLALSASAWKDARKAVEWPHLRGKTGPRFQRLEALGLDERQEPGRVLVTSREFPKMLYGLQALCSVPDSRYRYMDYLRLDFRGALRGGPEVEDIFSTLSPERACIVKALNRAVSELELRPKIKPLREITSGSRWKVEYQEKGKSRAGFYAGPDSLTLCLYFGEAEHISETSAFLWEQDAGLAAWFDARFPERLCKCPNNRRVRLGGGPRRICGLSNRAEVSEPAWEDLENCLKVLRLFRESGGGA